MRPERLEVAGFGVFRDPVEIDFRGADLFALSGPTGAGKSTIIDAIVFALYGVVPRNDDKRLVGASISEGKVEARVRFDFAVGGELYTALRIVRRKGKTGAVNTDEARLERVDRASGAVEVVAGTAAELSFEVEQLLGLSYDHFTTCVVLPQGEFQRFLHQKPAARQDLLVELLDLSIYGRMAQAATARAKAAQHQREWITQQLGELAGVTAEQRGALEAALADAEKLLVQVDDALPALDALTQQAAEARRAADDARANVVLLADVRVPDGVTDLGDELARALHAVELATKAEDAAADALATAEAALDALPDRGVLTGALRDHDDRATETSRITKGEQVVAGARDNEAAAQADLEAAQAAHADAARALDAARRTNRAHELAMTLVVGDPCPVCLQVVPAAPEHEVGDLDALVRAEASAASAVTETTEALQGMTTTRVRMEDLLVEVRRRIAELDERLADHPDADAIRTQLAGFEVVEAAAKAARAEATSTRKARQAAEQQVQAARAHEQSARRAFDTTRDRLAVLQPPAAERDDLLADWTALVEWTATQLPAHQRAADEAVQAAARADDERAERHATLVDACRALGVDPGNRPVRDVVVEHLSAARAELDQLDRALARADELRADDARIHEQEQVASALATHLRSTHFEKWVLDEVLHRLVAAATSILFELSGGVYSLTFDAKSTFCVIDHANADATRSARTLSGGETFLASLALALALADEIAQLAATGSVRLESIFLDEGFGTLDPATLDTVASAIEELGARGRMVGVISHVRDLADRLPVRFEVTKTGNASTVTRVEQ
jgi:exonuclease SbcC